MLEFLTALLAWVAISIVAAPLVARVLSLGNASGAFSEGRQQHQRAA